MLFIDEIRDNKENIKRDIAQAKIPNYDCDVNDGRGYKTLLEIGLKYVEEYDMWHKGVQVIGDNDYSGDMMLIVGCDRTMYIGDVYITYVGYGSCSVCDTILGIIDYDGEWRRDDAKLEAMYTIILHMFERMIKPWETY